MLYWYFFIIKTIKVLMCNNRKIPKKLSNILIRTVKSYRLHVFNKIEFFYNLYNLFIRLFFTLNLKNKLYIFNVLLKSKKLQVILQVR